MSRRHAYVLALALAAAGSASAAQDAENDPLSEGLSLLEQGTRLLMQGIMEEFGSAWEELEDAISDLGAYHAPEVLPNGDIIIRRKIPLGLEPPPETEL